MKYNFLATLLLAVLLLELILKISPLYGALAYFAAAAIILMTVSKTDYKPGNKKQILLILTAILIIRIAALFIPLNFFWKTLAAYSLLTFITIVYAYGFKLPKREIRTRWVVWAVFATIILGYAGMVIAGFEKNLMFLALIPLIAFSEEYFFRGLLLNSVEREDGEKIAVFFSSIFYSILCLSYGLIAVFFFFSMSMLFGLIYTRMRSLFFMMVLNAIVHVFLFIKIA